MVDVSGIPNMGFGGGGYFGGSASQGLPAMSAAQINASMGWSPNAAQLNPWANTPGGFGGQTDYYSGLGAAYGRQTGGFPPAPDNGGYANPSGSVTRSDLLPLDYNDSAGMPSGGGGVSYLPDGTPIAGGGGFGGGGIGSDSARAPGAMFDTSRYAQQFRMPNSNPEYFNPGTYAGDQSNYGIPNNGRPQAGDIGFTSQSPMPNIGYNPSMQNQFANPDMGGGAFQGRFGMGFPGAGTPSQYAPGAQMPPGFAPQFGVDHPNGALPLGGFGDPYSVGSSQAGG